MSWRQYQVSDKAIAQARKLGLFGNVERRIIRMAQKSAPFTHPLANRRFEGFIMRIEGDVVASIMRFDPETGTVETDVLGKLKKPADD